MSIRSELSAEAAEYWGIIKSIWLWMEDRRREKRVRARNAALKLTCRQHQRHHYELVFSQCFYRGGNENWSSYDDRWLRTGICHRHVVFVCKYCGDIHKEYRWGTTWDSGWITDFFGVSIKADAYSDIEDETWGGWRDYGGEVGGML